MLAIRIEELLVQEQHIVSMVTEESKQRQLLLEDEEEDFLDEGTFSEPIWHSPARLLEMRV